MFQFVFEDFILVFELLILEEFRFLILIICCLFLKIVNIFIHLLEEIMSIFRLVIR
jgi:hypothetical protein